jgi:hypothetical protein
MGDFSADWLALREAADHRSRSPELAEEVVHNFAGQVRISVVDLGCGSFPANRPGVWSIMTKLSFTRRAMRSAAGPIMPKRKVGISSRRTLIAGSGSHSYARISPAILGPL